MRTAMREQQLIDDGGEFLGRLVPPAFAEALAERTARQRYGSEDGDDSSSVAAEDGDGATHRDERDYCVVAVIGSQSSGKSTLLNAAFGTAFPVLDAARHGRRRTTLGVWGAVVERDDGEVAVLLDVEGGDSRERGEGRHAFEMRTGLLSVALADVLVINIWSHDIGREHQGNTELFRLLFSQTLRVRENDTATRQKKLRLLVTLRDFDDEEASFDDAKTFVTDQLERIWAEVAQRSHSSSRSLAARPMSSTVQLDFLRLAHLKYAPEEFNTGAELFTQKVMSSSSTKKVVLGDFDEYARSMWRVISRDVDAAGWALDVPSHAELTIRSICENARQLAERSVEEDFLDFRYSLEVAWREPLGDFRERADAIVTRAVEEYDRLTARAYRSSAAYSAKRAQLVRSTLERLRRDRALHWETGLAHAFHGVERDVQVLNVNSREFDRAAKRARDRALERHSTFVRRSLFDRWDDEERFVESSKPGQLADAAASAGGGGGTCEGGGKGGGAAAVVESQTGVLRQRCDAMVRECKRLDELSRAGELGAPPPPPPWFRNPEFWKMIAIRGAILAFNYWQAQRQLNSNRRRTTRREELDPTGPTF